MAITISGPLRSAASWVLLSRPPTKWYKIRLEKNHLTSQLIIMNEINAIILERRMGKKSVCIFFFFYMLLEKKGDPGSLFYC